MSMSNDTRQLELASQFAELLELLMNPGKLEGILSNIRAVSADYKEKLGLITTKQEADMYRAQAERILEEARNYLTSEKQRQDAEAAQALASLTAKEKDVERTLQTLSKREAEANSNFGQAELAKQEADRLLASAYEQSKKLGYKEAELAALETRLNEKQAKLNQILG